MFGDPFLEYRANIRDTQIRVKSVVGDIPWRIEHGSKFRLITLDDLYIGFGGTAPHFNSICPNRFEYRFVDQYLVSQCLGGGSPDEPV
jgi:hypothetical protein